MADASLVATVTADAFCYSMVRNIVGAVVCVGEGRFEPEWISTLLVNKARVSESMVFPARGLTLIGVEYPSDTELQSRATITIRRRDEE
jgi:tRNA pseudouridine38-40 synthase